MPYLPTNRHYTYRSVESGLTLIEMLVVAPLIILLIGALVIAISNLTGSSLFSQEKNNAAYNVQSALDDMDTSVRYATKFLSTTGNLTYPQGKNNSMTPFTHDSTTDTYDTLIFTSAATDKSIYDSTRQLVYKGAGTCIATNPVYQYTTVYFVDPTTKALYKRTILPTPGALCRTVSQKNSCATVSGTLCVTRDEKLLDNVKSVKIEYLANPSSTSTTTPDLAQVAVITVTRSTIGGGEDVDYSGTLRVSRLNVNSINDSAVVANPAVSGYTTTATAGSAVFSWPQSANATGYNVTYRINSGTWQNGPQNTTSTSYTVPNLYRKQVAEVRVQAITSSGNFYYDNGSVTIPRWYESSTPLSSSWQNYGYPYNDAGFTKTSRGAVGLKGLVRYGSVGFGQTVFTLPAGFRPQDHLIFHAPSSNAAGSDTDFARIDIWPDGRISISQTPGNNTHWVSLDGIIFMTASGSPGWTNGSYASPWYFNNYGGDTYSNLKYYRDPLGRAWVQGLATGNSGYGSGQTMAWMSSAMIPQYGSLHLPTSADGRAGAVNINTSPQIVSRPSYGGYTSTQFLYYATGGLYPLALYNGWANYGYGWSSAQCFKGTDDIVILQGLVQGGNPAAGGMAGVHGCGSSPVGMSTGRNAILPAWRYNERAARVDLNTDNYLYPISTDSGWTSLDGTHYIAD